MTPVYTTGISIGDTGFAFTTPVPGIADTWSATDLAPASTVAIVTACHTVTDTYSATNLASASAATIVAAYRIVATGTRII